MDIGDLGSPDLFQLRDPERAEGRLDQEGIATKPGHMRAGGGVQNSGAPCSRMLADVVAVSPDVLVDGDGAVPDVLRFARHDQTGDDAGVLVVDGEDRALVQGSEQSPQWLAEVAYWPGPARRGGEVRVPAGGGEQVVQVAGP